MFVQHLLTSRMAAKNRPMPKNVQEFEAEGRRYAVQQTFGNSIYWRWKGEASMNPRATLISFMYESLGAQRSPFRMTM